MRRTSEVRRTLAHRCNAPAFHSEVKLIVTITVPQLRTVQGAPKTGRIRCHKLVQDQFRGLFVAWQDAGLIDLLRTWAGGFVPRFVRVVPNDYKRVLEAQRRMREAGLSPEEAEMAAFEQNAQDVARVGGK